MTTLNASEDAEKQDYSHIAGKNVKQCNLSGKRQLKKKKQATNIQPKIGLLGIHQRKMKICVHTETYT